MNINYLHAETAYYFYTLLGFRFVQWDKTKKMKVNIEYEIKLTDDELIDNFIKDTQRNALKIADAVLGEVSWHKNMPKSSKLRYIAMMQKHIDEFLKDLDHNNDLSGMANEA